MNPLPSRLKIALLSAGLSGVVLIVFGVFAWLTFYKERIAAMDREIKALATRHPGLFAGRGSFERMESSLEFTFGADYTNKVFLLLKDGSDRTLYESPQVPAFVLSLGPPPGGQRAVASTNEVQTNLMAQPLHTERGGLGPGWGRGGGFGGRGGPPAAVVFSGPPKFVTIGDGVSSWRVGLMEGDGLKLVLGLNLSEVRGELDRVRTAFLTTVPIALLVIGLGGWIVAGRTLRPLNSIAETAEAVTAQGLDRRIPVSNESPEMRRVITVLNGMMDRLEASFRQATRFSADASHELKTPLAVMQGELELALQGAEPGSPLQRLCSDLMESVQRLKTITRGLLLLAQADAGQLKVALEEVNLSAELDGLLEDARALSTNRKLVFETELCPGVVVQADRALLGTAVFNLLSNAVKYSEAGGRVRIELRKADERVSVLVGNSGQAIPPEDQSKIFDRFHRVRQTDNTPVEGIGLGLSLAREIARAHGGDVELVERRPGWTCFLLRLPYKK